MLAVAALLGAACAHTPQPLPPPAAPPPPASVAPGPGCERALAHVVTLALRAIGEGPSNAQRSTFLERCAAAADPAKGTDCVLALRALPGRRGGSVGLEPALRCLGK